MSKGNKGNKPLGKRIKEVLDFLDPHKSVTAEDIKNQIGVDVYANNGEVLNELKVNPKVDYENGLFKYKPLYSLKDKENLMKLIDSTPDGIDTDDLKDSYKGIQADIQDLVNSEYVLHVENTELKHEIIYPHDRRFAMDVSPDFQKLWASVRVPDMVDFEKEMHKANLTMMQVESRKRPTTKTKKKRKQRPTKLTNVHLAGTLDLTQDFVPSENTASAFNN